MKKIEEPFTIVDRRSTETAEPSATAILNDVYRPKPDAAPTRSAADIEAAVAFHYAEGRTSATVHEVYEHGLPLWCFTAGKPNTAMVRPIRRPAESAGGIITTTDAKRGTLGTNALCYVVLALGDEVGPDDVVDQWLHVAPSDVVVLRNAMLEPLDETLNTHLISRQHILSKVDVTGW
jgi:hypothetical protein